MKNTLTSFALVMCTMAANLSLAAGIGDRHQAFGLVQEPQQAECLECHGSYAALGAKTQALEPNPHASHLGQVQCNACHSWQDESRLMCLDCHSFPDLERRLQK